jgi:penicillin-binding protein 1A
LNKIFLGHHAYGVAAAAQVYYGKPLAELNIPQYAMIAGLPKAPSTLNPMTNPQKALDRRNYVLKRMYETDVLSQQEYKRYLVTPISAHKQHRKPDILAPYFAEMVRYEIFKQYGSETYNSGLKVYTTLNSRLQKAARNALHFALHEYDQRHGYRKQNSQLFSEQAIGDTLAATVNTISNDMISATLTNQTIINIPWQNLKWARPFKGRNHLGPSPKIAADIVKSGDHIRVKKLTDNTWKLSQIPEPEGALVALNPNSGAIVALTGGFDFNISKFNRATQAKRQPGSGFKPILYTHALEEGYTAASLINDAPVVISGHNRQSDWRPQNYSGRFFGPTRLRTALRKSRNLVSVRLMRRLGVANVVTAAKRFGLPEAQLPKSLSLALGSGHATPLEMATIFSVFANGGFKVEPYFISRIENYRGKVLFQANPAVVCPDCNDTQLTSGNYAPRIISPQISFIMNTLLRDVVNRGTATRALALGRTDLAGKTGTTNEQRDAWFNGYAPSLTAISWVGFDNSKPLGHKETGGRVALPMWMHFMKSALIDTPEVPLSVPEGIVRRYIDLETGLLAAAGSNHGMWEYFRTQLAPTTRVLPDFLQAEIYGDFTDESLAGESPVESLF